MKNLFLLAFIVITNNCFCQNSWSTEHIQVLDRFGLTKDDPRGVVFYTSQDINCTNTHETVLKAIEAFLTTEIKSDLIYFCVPEILNKDIVIGQPLELFQIVSIYLAEVNK